MIEVIANTHGDGNVTVRALIELRELRADVEQLRTALGRQHALATGNVRCEDARCLASIDYTIIASSAWIVDDRGWWLCPMHDSKETP